LDDLINHGREKDTWNEQKLISLLRQCPIVLLKIFTL
jgi:hypothetical protein